MKLILMGVAALAAIGAAPLAAQADDAAASPAAGEKICRTQQATGSRLQDTEVCMTAAEWGAAAAALQSAASTKPATQGDEKKICRTDRATDSRVRATRVCLTAAEWDRVRNQSTRTIDNMASRSEGDRVPRSSNR